MTLEQLTDPGRVIIREENGQYVCIFPDPDSPQMHALKDVLANWYVQSKLINKVKEMRLYQRQYFKKPTPDLLQLAKITEQEVDNMIAYAERITPQITL